MERSKRVKNIKLTIKTAHEASPSRALSQHSPVSPLPRELTIICEAQLAVARTLEANVGLTGLQLHEEAALWSAVEVVFAQPFAGSDPLIFILGKEH